MDRRSFLAVTAAAAAVVALPAAAAKPGWVPGTIIPRGQWDWVGQPIPGLVRGCWGLQEVESEDGNFWKLHHLGNGYHAVSTDDRKTIEAFADLIDATEDFSGLGIGDMPTGEQNERIRQAFIDAGYMRVSNCYWV